MMRGSVTPSAIAKLAAPRTHATSARVRMTFTKKPPLKIWGVLEQF
jgi:hypothetical protein